MIIENLTTVSKYQTEKVTSQVIQKTVTNPANSGSSIPSDLWQLSNVTSNSYQLTDEDGNIVSYTDVPLVRAKWSVDGGSVWYDSGTSIPYTYTLSGSGSGGSFSQRTPGNMAACTIGIDKSNLYVRTASGYHGNVSVNTGTGNATWTGISQDFTIRYATLEASENNIVVSSKNTIPINKVLATGTASFSGSVPSATTFTQDIDIDYEPEFFAIEFNVLNHVYDVSTGNLVPNGTFTHWSRFGFIIASDTDPNLVFISGGIVSGSSPKLRLSAFVTNGGPTTTSTSFSVQYRIIDLGVKQTISGSDMTKLALSNVGNSSSRDFTISTGTGGTANTTTAYANPFGGNPFVDYYFDCDGDGVYWRNGYKQDAGQMSPAGGVSTSASAMMYTTTDNISAIWITGDASPSGKSLRYVSYGDYT